MSVGIYISYNLCSRRKMFFYFFKLLCVRTLTPSFVCSVLFFIIITHPFGYEILFSPSSQKGIYVYYIIRRTSAASGCRPTLFSRFSFRFPPHIYQRLPHPYNIQHTHAKCTHPRSSGPFCSSTFPRVHQPPGMYCIYNVCY